MRIYNSDAWPTIFVNILNRFMSVQLYRGVHIVQVPMLVLSSFFLITYLSFRYLIPTYSQRLSTYRQEGLL